MRGRTQVVGALFGAAAIALVLAAMYPEAPGVGSPAPPPVALSTPAPAPPEPSTLAEIEPAPALVTPVRITIPSTGIDAPVIIGAVDLEARQMIAPEGPEEVAWYDYSGVPGAGGNAVLAGHVDQRSYGPAVFWDLRQASPGDTMQIWLSDGTILSYRIDWNEVFELDDGPWGELFASSAGSNVITVYTCDGVLGADGYSARRVVRASLISSAYSPMP